MTDRLIIFTRYPEPGQVKTRLIPVLGPRGAAELHRRLTMHTLGWAQELASRGGVELTVRFDGGDVNLMRKCFGANFHFVRQSLGDLGQRLADALSDTCAPTVAIGTDCPAITPGHVLYALAALRRAEVVLGPATDGGYYLIGLTSPQPSLFANIPWGTDRVCETTLFHARSDGLRVKTLEALSDVDRPEDLADLPRNLMGTESSPAIDLGPG
jgi:rSAM/selenodomain-associated transferase 1